MNKKISVCYVCTGNACRSPFAECVTKALLQTEGMEGIEVYSLGTIHCEARPRDAAMVEVAREMGYALTGTTTCMDRWSLRAADCIIVFDEYQRNAVTRELDYDRWSRIVLFNQLAFGTTDPVEDPHLESADTYRRVARHIAEGCQRIVEKWKEG